jgi:thymidine kinase
MSDYYKIPEFIIFTGPMFGSKTTKLMASVDRYRYQNKNVKAFKPKIDNRYSRSEIVTHSGGKIAAKIVSHGKEIIECIDSSLTSVDVVAVDEAFMIEGAADALVSIFQMGITVVVSSLDLSANCKTFAEIEKIMCWSTRIEKCPAVCPVCGADAYYTFRKVEAEQEILVGGSDIYEPRCWNHHPHFSRKQNA